MAVFASSSRRVLLGAATALLCCAGVSSAGVAAAGAASTAPGHWTVLDAGKATSVEAGTPTLWIDPSHHAWILWLSKLSSSTTTYKLAKVAANGTVTTKATDIFAGGDWTSLSNTPTLLPAGAVPQVVFSGGLGSTGPYANGCVVTASGSTSPWTLGTGSLAGTCVNPIGVSAESKTGVLATAFPGGWATGHGVIYHIGVSAAIPASEADGQLAIANGTAYKASMVNDLAGTGDFSIAYAQEFSTPASGDGFYVKDVTSGSGLVKAPGSGTTSINDLPVFGNVAVTNTNTHAGVYLAYCSNTSTCKVQLWKVGAAKAVTVPGSSGAFDLAVAPGPAGRLWISWYNEQSNKLFVVRTNPSETKFGPVKSYATGCFEHGLIGLAGVGGRLDIALQCVNNGNALVQEQVTQSLVPLHVGLSATSVTNTAKHTLTVSVTDVGTPVKGAKVVVAGHKATTNAKGKATITLPKGAKAGSYQVSAAATDYVTGTAGLSIKS
ncbi:hypothetical protein acdb102_32760 [Acidothermaceae bacterium B102]|nr:hypothetical protein acdb102_32760 [Acidothermaceae bacterium B102]